MNTVTTQSVWTSRCMTHCACDTGALAAKRSVGVTDKRKVANRLAAA